VVRVGDRSRGDRPGRVPAQAVHVEEQAHQLGHRERGVRVVELDRVLVGEVLDGGALEEEANRSPAARTTRRSTAARAAAACRPRSGRSDRGPSRCSRSGPCPRRRAVVADLEGVEVELFVRGTAPEPEEVGVRVAVAEHGRVVGHALHDALGDPPDAQVARARRRRCSVRPPKPTTCSMSQRRTSQGLPWRSQLSVSSNCQPLRIPWRRCRTRSGCRDRWRGCRASRASPCSKRRGGRGHHCPGPALPRARRAPRARGRAHRAPSSLQPRCPARGGCCRAADRAGTRPRGRAPCGARPRGTCAPSSPSDGGADRAPRARARGSGRCASRRRGTWRDRSRASSRSRA
jgi:hypothetical protein